MASAVCPACGLKVRTCLPAGGDGSAEVYVRHLGPDGVEYCWMSRDIVDASREENDGG